LAFFFRGLGKNKLRGFFTGKKIFFGNFHGHFSSFWKSEFFSGKKKIPFHFFTGGEKKGVFLAGGGQGDSRGAFFRPFFGHFFTFLIDLGLGGAKFYLVFFFFFPFWAGFFSKKTSLSKKGGRGSCMGGPDFFPAGQFGGPKKWAVQKGGCRPTTGQTRGGGGGGKTFGRGSFCKQRKKGEKKGKMPIPGVFPGGPPGPDFFFYGPPKKAPTICCRFYNFFEKKRAA